MESIEKHSELIEQLSELFKTRRNEILTEMLITDGEYKRLCEERADASMALKNAVVGTEAARLFEEYSDTIFAQEVYELDSIYKQAVYDILEIIENKANKSEETL